MRIAVFGTGAVGGYFGGRLAAAGEDVSFIARGAQLAAMQEHGLRITSPKGDLHIPVTATSDPASVGPVDVVMFTVKLYDVEASAPLLAPLIGPDTVTTLPRPTVAALLDHGQITRTIDRDLAEAATTIDRLATLGIDLETIGDALLADGIQQFVSAYDRLEAVIQERVTALAV